MKLVLLLINSFNYLLYLLFFYYKIVFKEDLEKIWFCVYIIFFFIIILFIIVIFVLWIVDRYYKV